MTSDRFFGVDVSGWQSVEGADYECAQSRGDMFVIAKLSQGTRRSKKGLRHAGKANACGMPVGAYHFATPKNKGRGEWDATAQAACFCQAALESKILDYQWPFVNVPRLWLDMEWISFGKGKRNKEEGKAYRKGFPPSDVMDWTREFIGFVQAELGERCGIYTGRSFVRHRYRYNPELALYDLWLASYVQVGKDRQAIPSDERWPKPIELSDNSTWDALIWQFTGRGSVYWYRKGKGKIDRNIINLSKAKP